MKIKFNEHFFNIEDCEVSQFSSIKSGKPITKINGSVKIEESLNPGDFQKMKSVQILIDDASKIVEYSLLIEKSLFSATSSYWTFVISCTEIEKYAIKIVTFNEITIAPYEYSEEEEDDALIINLRANVNDEQFKKIRKGLFEQSCEKSISYFTVKRDDLIEKTMRYGQPIWSKNENEYNISLVLVENTYDKEPKRQLQINDPDFSNLRELSATNEIILNNLLQILIDKNILSETEKNSIKNISLEDLFNARFELKKVKNIDDVEK
jgi:hypothetical protein